MSGIYEFKARSTPVIDSVRAAYRALGPQGWLATKLRMAGELIVGLGRPIIAYGEMAKISGGPWPISASRAADFFIFSRSLGLAGWIGVVAALSPPLRDRARASDTDRTLAWSVVIGFTGILLMWFVFMDPKGFVTHVLPYGSIALILFGGFAAITRLPRYARWSVAGLSAIYFVVFWLAAPFYNGARFVPSAAFGFVLAIAVIVYAAGRLATADQTALPAYAGEDRTTY